MRQSGITPTVLSDPKLMLFALNPIEPLDLDSVCSKHLSLDLNPPAYPDLI
jgi:hypothetical protein